jgi:hypothetical protein
MAIPGLLVVEVNGGVNSGVLGEHSARFGVLLEPQRDHELGSQELSALREDGRLADVERGGLSLDELVNDGGGRLVCHVDELERGFVEAGVLADGPVGPVGRQSVDLLEFDVCGGGADVELDWLWCQCLV